MAMRLSPAAGRCSGLLTKPCRFGYLRPSFVSVKRHRVTCGALYHIVQEGETLQEIAGRYGVTVQHIKALNYDIFIERQNASQTMQQPEDPDHYHLQVVNDYMHMSTEAASEETSHQAPEPQQAPQQEQQQPRPQDADADATAIAQVQLPQLSLPNIQLQMQTAMQHPTMQRVTEHLQQQGFWYYFAIGSAVIGALMAKILYEGWQVSNSSEWINQEHVKEAPAEPAVQHQKVALFAEERVLTAAIKTSPATSKMPSAAVPQQQKPRQQKVPPAAPQQTTSHTKAAAASTKAPAGLLPAPPAPAAALPTAVAAIPATAPNSAATATRAPTPPPAPPTAAPSAPAAAAAPAAGAPGSLGHRLSGMLNNMVPFSKVGPTSYETTTAQPEQPTVGSTSAADIQGLVALKGQLLDAVRSTSRGLEATAEQRAAIEEQLLALEARNVLTAGAQLRAQLDGCWKLVYTNNSRVLLMLHAIRSLQRVEAGDICQCIDGSTLQATNRVDVSVPLGLVLTARSAIEMRSSQQHKVRLTQVGLETRVQTPQLLADVQIPDHASVMGVNLDLTPLQRLVTAGGSGLAAAGRLVQGVVAADVRGEVPVSSLAGDRLAMWMTTTYLDSGLRVSRDDAGKVYVMLKDACSC